MSIINDTNILTPLKMEYKWSQPFLGMRIVIWIGSQSDGMCGGIEHLEEKVMRVYTRFELIF